MPTSAILHKATPKPAPVAQDGRFLMLLLYLLEFYLLTVLYTTYLAPFWEYNGFELIPNQNKIAAAVAIIAGFVCVTPLRASVRGFYLNLLLSTHFIPAMVLFSYADKPLASAAVFVGAYAILYMSSAIPITRIKVANIRASLLLGILATAVICVVLSYPLIAGLGTFNLNVAAVYDFRREAAAALPGVFGYLSPLVTNVLIPVCTAIALAKKRYGIVVAFMAIAILQFGFTNHKSPLFAPFITIGVYYFLLRFGRYSAILIGLVAGLLFGLIDTVMLVRFGDDFVWGWFNTLLVRRTLMTPAQLDYLYIDFFSENAKYYWSSSRISLGMASNPYGDIGMPFLIGEIYFDAPEMSANTGFIGSGYAQAGFIGVVLYSTGVGIIIGIFESYGKYFGIPFIISATIIMSANFTATDFLTLFMTHGLAIFVFLLMITRFDWQNRSESGAIGTKGQRQQLDA